MSEFITNFLDKNAYEPYWSMKKDRVYMGILVVELITLAVLRYYQ